MPNQIELYNWSDWKSFPDPRIEGMLTAPYGNGLYQLKNIKTDEFILFGIGKNCAYRMSSLLPKPFGQGTRNNESKRAYLINNISSIEYRTLSFTEESEMKIIEKEIKKLEIHKFNT